jgi:hypothetical protein
MNACRVQKKHLTQKDYWGALFGFAKDLLEKK